VLILCYESDPSEQSKSTSSTIDEVNPVQKSSSAIEKGANTMPSTPPQPSPQLQPHSLEKPSPSMKPGGGTSAEETTEEGSGGSSTRLPTFQREVLKSKFEGSLGTRIVTNAGPISSPVVEQGNLRTQLNLRTNILSES